MTLYGLDLVQDREGKYHLLEINGVLSGMKGFEQVYGDDRVQQRVYRMLEQRYGKITINNGTYAKLQYKKDHPWKYRLYSLLFKSSFVQRVAAKKSEILHLNQAFTEWMNEKVPVSASPTWPYETYTGQESAVVNILRNEEVLHPLVNPFVTEEAGHNKFFFYQLMKDSEVKEHIIPSALIGLGFSYEADLEKVLGTDQEQFVIKPIRGSLGKGLHFIPRKRAEEYLHSRGPISNALLDSMIYIEDLVKQEDFDFEYGLALLQPFVDSRRTIEGEEIECPRHGARFNVKTGKVTAPPAYEDIRSFETRVVGDDIEVAL